MCQLLNLTSSCTAVLAEYNYSTAAPPSMQNDTITISRHHSNDPEVKLAICHALAQVWTSGSHAPWQCGRKVCTQPVCAFFDFCLCCFVKALSMVPTCHLFVTGCLTALAIASTKVLLLRQLLVPASRLVRRHPVPVLPTPASFSVFLETTSNYSLVLTSYPLLQSTKLCVHEERVLELVLETKHMPQTLAQHGTVNVTAEEVAQRIGQVFIQRVSAGSC